MYDVAIIGSGPGGSVAAMLLAKLGYQVTMLERGQHPRFALGESSTPVMSKKIREMGRKYDIPELVELSSYDRIADSERPVVCAPKELFHYFYHEPGQTRAKINGEYPEIVVQTPDVDTQFLRADLDQRLVEYAVKYGADYRDKTEVRDVEFGDDGVRITTVGDDGAERLIECKFVIDATGFRSFLAQKFDLRQPDESLDTPLKSRCIFTHFKDVGRLEDAVEPDPMFNQRLNVDRGHATQHHCFDGGWYWFIPLGNGVTSIGLSLDIDVYPDTGRDPEEEFWEFTNRYPIVRAMLEGRETTLPYCRTGRMQFRTKEAVGDRWALLPAAAIGMDAWFSTGMGLTMLGADRLVSGLHERVLGPNCFKREALEFYERALFKEWWYITRMMDGIYKSFKHFEVFKYYCFFCFMGAESYVHSGGIRRPLDEDYLLLNVANRQFTDRFSTIYDKVREYHAMEQLPEGAEEYLQGFLQSDMKEFNYRDYGNPSYSGIHYRLEKGSPHFDMD